MPGLRQVVVAHRDQVYSRHAVNVNVHELFAGLKMFPDWVYIDKSRYNEKYTQQKYPVLPKGWTCYESSFFVYLNEGNRLFTFAYCTNLSEK